MPEGSDDPAVPHRKRCRRYNTPGHAHYLTFSCFQRKPFLNSDRTRQWLVEAVDLARRNHAFDLWAYVIMPEHSHLLVFPTHEIYSISDILSTIKQSVAKRAISFVRSRAPDFLEEMADRQPRKDHHALLATRRRLRPQSLESVRHLGKDRIHPQQSCEARTP